MPIPSLLAIAAWLCSVDENEVIDQPMSVRRVACEIGEDQVGLAGLPGLLLVQQQDDGSPGQDTCQEADDPNAIWSAEMKARAV